MIFLDSSLLVSMYCPEAASAKVEAAVRARLPATVSDLVEVEFVSALAIKVRTGGLQAADALAYAQRLGSHMEVGVFERLTLERRHYRQAREWIVGMTCPLRSGDALHMALAHDLGIALVTADKKMAGACKTLGVSCTLIAT